MAGIIVLTAWPIRGLVVPHEKLAGNTLSALFYVLIEIFEYIRIFFPQYEYIHIRIRMKISRTNIFVFVFSPEKNICSPLQT